MAGFSVADCLAWSKALDVLLQAISVSSNVCLSAEASSRRKEMEVEHAGAKFMVEDPCFVLGVLSHALS